MNESKHKQKILSLLQKKHLLSIAEIHALLPKADYSTIFRNVESLTKEKSLKRIVIDNKSTVYELGDHRHDHFICGDCHKIEPISIPRVSIKGHKIDDITVRGLCNTCIK